MNEHPKSTQAELPSDDELQERREAFAVEARARSQSDAKRLGHLAAGHEVNFDEHGTLLTDSEVKELASGNVAIKE